MIRINEITRGRMGNKILHYNTLAQLGASKKQDVSCGVWEDQRFFTNTIPHKSPENPETRLTWREILAAVGSSYRTPSNTSGLSSGLQRAIIQKRELSSHVSILVDMEDKERILMQMEALGLMTAQAYSLKGGGSAIFHKLTNDGVATMLRENVVRTAQD